MEAEEEGEIVASGQALHSPRSRRRNPIVNELPNRSEQRKTGPARLSEAAQLQELPAQNLIRRQEQAIANPRQTPVCTRDFRRRFYRFDVVS